MNAAAPQAPGSTTMAAKKSAKGLARSATSADPAVFAGLLAKTVAAKGSASGKAAVPVPVSMPAAENAKAAAATAKATGRAAVRSGGQRRADEASAAGRDAVEHAVGRTAAAQLQIAAAAPTSAARTGGQAAGARRTEPRVQVVILSKKPAAADAPETVRSEPKTAAGAGDGTPAAAKPFSERLAAADGGATTAVPARPTPLERIREMTGSDLARTIGLVVRDGGGEIRLTLKPESLGSVRIRLSLEDGMVEGRIVVDTPEARQAFEAGIESLTRALHADGFQTGSLQVTVSGGDANGSRQAAGLLGDTISAARLRASDEAVQAAVPLAGWNGGGDGLVNVFA